MTAVCDTCHRKYDIKEQFINCIVFCPDCKKKILVSRTDEHGPVIPCSVYIGSRHCGTITVKGMRYRLVLEKPFMDEPLLETPKDLLIYDEAERLIVKNL